jgi:hypothetical protein
MQYVLIIHEVADYPAWKKVFDAAAELRREAGERSYQVLSYYSMFKFLSYGSTIERGSRF